MFYDSTEMEVHALAAAPNGGLYVGTSPDGRIYRVDAKGQATPFFDPDDKYIWSLAVDRDGNVFAGTGDKGTVYKIIADGKGAEVLRDQDRARGGARVRSETAAARRHRRARPRVPRRRGRQGLPAARHDLPGNARHSRRSEGRDLRRGAKRPRSQGGGDSLTDAATAPPPVTPSIPNVSTEITSIVGRRHRPVVAVERRRRRGGSPQPRPAPCSACSPMDCGTRCGRRATTRRTTSRSSPMARCWSPPARKGKLFRLSGDPVSAVLVTRVPAQQATMMRAPRDRTLRRHRRIPDC